MKKCFECETTEDLQEHHVVPRSRGGTKTVTLCYECHMKAHGRTGKGLNHSRLTKEGLAKAKARGVKLGTHAMDADGRKKVLEARFRVTRETNERLFPHIAEANSLGFFSLREVAKYLNNKGIPTPRGRTWTAGTMSPIMKRYRKEITKENK